MAPPHLGTKKINKMLTMDYADGKPFHVFRAEIDIPLGKKTNYTKLKKLLDRSQTAEVREKTVKLLLEKLGSVSRHATASEKTKHQAARHFVAAAFDLEPPKVRR